MELLSVPIFTSINQIWCYKFYRCIQCHGLRLAMHIYSFFKVNSRWFDVRGWPTKQVEHGKLIPLSHPLISARFRPLLHPSITGRFRHLHHPSITHRFRPLLQTLLISLNILRMSALIVHLAQFRHFYCSPMWIDFIWLVKLIHTN